MSILGVLLRTRVLIFGLGITPGFLGGSLILQGQTQAAAPSAARQIGTVKAISGNALTLTTDAGQQLSVSVVDGARILQLAPGSTDLKSAQAIALTDIGAGDRVLVTGKVGDDAGALTASRVILMKSTDIAQKNETEKADWQKRGAGGLVSAVDAETLTISAGAKKIQVQTSGNTKFRRYAGDSVKFEDTKPGTLSQIQVGDQLRVRGAKSEDGSSIQAEEVVSGSFKNLAGTIASVDAPGGTLTLKDLTTKRNVMVKVTPNSDVRRLPPQAAAMFAARAKGGASGPGEVAAGGQGARPAGSGSQRTPGGMGTGAGQGSGQATGPGSGPAGVGRSAGMDLSQMLSRLPTDTIADLKAGDAVMIVASQSEPGSAFVTAVTLLAGVEPILAANPTGAPAMTLSPWNVGGGAPDAGSSQ